MDDKTDLERCPYCGARVEAPCDEPPPDTCEEAMTATFRTPEGKVSE